MTDPLAERHGFTDEQWFADYPNVFHDGDIVSVAGLEGASCVVSRCSLSSRSR